MSNSTGISHPANDDAPARRDVAEILEAMDAYFGPHTVMRTPRAPFPPVPFVIDHVEPRWSLGALSGLYLAALGGITAGALAYALMI